MKRHIMRSLIPVLVWSSGCGSELEQETFVFDVPVREIRVTNGDADLEIVGGASDEVRVEVFHWWTRHRPSVDIEVRDDVLDIDYASRDDHTMCVSQLEIMVPWESDVTVDADDGDVMLTDIDGVVSVMGDRSDVWGFSLASPWVEVNTDDGDVALQHDAAPELLSIETIAGDVEVSIPSGSYDLDLDTLEGGILVSPHIDADPSSSHRIEIASMAGNIYLHATHLPGHRTRP